MAMCCALDWRHGLVSVALTNDADDRHVRLVLGHGPDELVVHLTQDSMDTLTLAGLTCPRPKGDHPWNWTLLSGC